MAPQFSKNSLWWNLNKVNGYSIKPTAKPAKSTSQVAAAGG